ncbi:MAG: AEC family transporter [Clostridiales Family XIII bacterium]|jgi:predicted permease|nr:AEC family transporter [Clostridiales Family XIII bacterium]
MVTLRVLAILVLVFVGFGANKIGWLPVDSSKYLSKIVINMAAPCVMIMSMTEQELSRDNIRIVLTCFAICVVGYGASWLIGLLFNRVLRVPAGDRGVYINSMIFTNNGFMGMPVAYAAFGSQGLFYIVMIGSIAPLFQYTVGVGLCRMDCAARGGAAQAGGEGGWARHLKPMVTPPTIGFLVAIALFAADVHVTGFAADILNFIGSLMTPLVMMVIGIQISESRVKDLVRNYRLCTLTVVRLCVLPLIAYFVLMPFHLDGLLFVVAVLNFVFPCAAVMPSITEEYGGNAKLSAEITFVTTVFSIIAVPVWIMALSPLAA